MINCWLQLPDMSMNRLKLNGLVCGVLILISIFSPSTPGQTQDKDKTISASEAISSANALDSRIDLAKPQATPSPTPQFQTSDPKWHYGGFVDVGYLLDFNHPANRVFRSRGTTWHVDRPQINMAAVYLRKKAEENSR